MAIIIGDPRGARRERGPRQPRAERVAEDFGGTEPAPDFAQAISDALPPILEALRAGRFAEAARRCLDIDARHEMLAPVQPPAAPPAPDGQSSAASRSVDLSEDILRRDIEHNSETVRQNIAAALEAGEYAIAIQLFNVLYPPDQSPAVSDPEAGEFSEARFVTRQQKKNKRAVDAYIDASYAENRNDARQTLDKLDVSHKADHEHDAEDIVHNTVLRIYKWILNNSNVPIRNAYSLFRQSMHSEIQDWLRGIRAQKDTIDLARVGLEVLQQLEQPTEPDQALIAKENLITGLLLHSLIFENATLGGKTFRDMMSPVTKQRMGKTLERNLTIVQMRLEGEETGLENDRLIVQRLVEQGLIEPVDVDDAAEMNRAENLVQQTYKRMVGHFTKTLLDFLQSQP